MKEAVRLEYCYLGKQLEILRYEISQLCKTREDMNKNIELIQKLSRRKEEIFEKILKIEKRCAEEI